MATLVSVRGTDNAPVGGLPLSCSFGEYTITSNPTAADTIRECWVPENSRIVGGWIYAKSIDDASGSTEQALDIDFGWEENSALESADPDGLGNFGLWAGDPVVGIKPESGIYFPLGGVLFSTGFKKFSANTRLTLTVNSAAGHFLTGGGHVSVCVFYVIDE